MSLEVQIFSDLHLETLDYYFEISPEKDILILAGDIGIIGYDNFVPFMDYVSKNWKTIFYVLGNHEFYIRSSHYVKTRKLYKSFFENYDNIHLLDESVYYHTDDSGEITCFIGATLWSQIDPGLENRLNCLNHIKVYNKKKKKRYYINEKQYNYLNRLEINFIKKMIKENSRFRIVVITHYPTILDQAKNDKYGTVNKNILKLYHNDLNIDTIKNDNIVCIAGHTHCSYDFKKNGVRYISNQKGYSNNFEKNQAKLKFDGNYTLF